MKTTTFHHNPRMQIAGNRTWWPRLAAFVLAALVAGSLVYWALKWPASEPVRALQPATGPRNSGADPTQLARALGGNAAPVAVAARPVVAAVSLASRMSLVGVVANSRQGGTALISVDGKPARPFRVGSKIEGEWLLQSVAPRRAVVSSGVAGEADVTLELPTLKSR